MRLGLTKHVTIHVAFLYNRDQMRGPTSFDAYHIFAGRKAQIVQHLERLLCRVAVKCFASRFIALSVPVPGNNLLKARHTPLFVPLAARVCELFTAAQNRGY